LFDWLIICLVGLLVCLLVAGWLFGCLIDRLGGWVVGLVGWLVGWVGGWFGWLGGWVAALVFC